MDLEWNTRRDGGGKTDKNITEGARLHFHRNFALRMFSREEKGQEGNKTDPARQAPGNTALGRVCTPLFKPDLRTQVFEQASGDGRRRAGEQPYWKPSGTMFAQGLHPDVPRASLQQAGGKGGLGETLSGEITVSYALLSSWQNMLEILISPS